MNILQIRATKDSLGILMMSESGAFEQWTVFQEGEERITVGHIGDTLETKRLPWWIHLAR